MSSYSPRTATGLEGPARGVDQTEGEPWPTDRVSTGERVHLPHQRDASIEGNVSPRDSERIRGISIPEAREPIPGMRRQAGVQRASALELPEEVPHVVGGIAPPGGIHVEQDEAVSRPDELPGGEVAVDDPRGRRVEILGPLL